MNRLELVTPLKLVAACLAPAKDPIPVNPCFCFTGTEVYTFNDQAALVAPFKSVWKGAIQGATMLGWLDASKAKDIEVEPAATSLAIKAGRAKTELPILPVTEFRFAVPDLAKAPSVKLDASALVALKRATLSMDEGTAHPWRTGVQAIFTEKEVTWFTCDDASAVKTYATCETPKELRGASPLLPPAFVKLLLARGGTEVRLTLTPEWYAATLDDGAVLYSAVPEATDVPTFQGLFSDVSKYKKDAAALPATWWGAMTRLNVLLAADKGLGHAAVEVKDGKMVLTILSALGQARESFKMETVFKVSALKIPPAIVARAVGEVTKFSLAEGPRLMLFADTMDMVIAAGA